MPPVNGLREINTMLASHKHLAPTALSRALWVCVIVLFFIGGTEIVGSIAAQTRRRPRTTTRPKTQTSAPRGAPPKYSAFLHSSDKHKNLTCNECHKVPTSWTAKRDFPDVADFPDHDACVRCHRQQFFTRQAMIGTGPAICTVCHVRAAPREQARFAFGKPNNSAQQAKAKDERQFTIEFPHDKHQNVIAMWHGLQSVNTSLHHRLKSVPLDDKKPDYNNCSICHQTDMSLAIVALAAPNADPALLHPFKSMPRTHDSCFNCHWKNQKPAAADCAGCHKAAPTFIAELGRKRISAKFAHEGGKGEHIAECTTCHINITRVSTTRGLTPDVPLNACAACHRDSKKITYSKAVTIEAEIEQFNKTGECSYCHTPDVGKKKPPASHDAAVQ
ncbi:MAG TPA: cytochrome c3 family protein [Pyrinomonadaceae bacterium]|nr:cytochrome c3 family protein [Pyrinomonadaceae bacterium]